MFRLLAKSVLSLLLMLSGCALTAQTKQMEAQFPSFSENLKALFRQAQLNSLSLKVLYYIDWQYFQAS